MSESKQEGSQSAGTLETQPTLNGYETKNSKRNHIRQDRFVRMERILDKIDRKLNPIEARMINLGERGIEPSRELKEQYRRLFLRWIKIINSEVRRP